MSDADKYPLKLADCVVMGLHPKKAPSEVVWSSSPKLVVEDVPLLGFTGDRFYRPMWVSDSMQDYTGTVMAIDFRPW
ncbi:hypothetical protein [Nitrincola sp. A-D6]|uniref:hypothetical protein n=1 Tax=Nitrincola sp. A-D6 TaxID=1545442 RepID=UPI00190F4449|nr:hypothetical protein [Nitrincola sp. A-D6]